MSGLQQVVNGEFKYFVKIIKLTNHIYEKLINFKEKFIFAKGKIATHLFHPTFGWNTLYRGDIKTLEELEEIFANPRKHTGKGTKKYSIEFCFNIHI